MKLMVKTKISKLDVFIPAGNYDIVRWFVNVKEIIVVI
jgi:hypothetical protein